jgi:hypothetical protein
MFTEMRGRALAKGKARFANLLVSKGGTYSYTDVAEMLGFTDEDLCREVEERNLLAFVGAAGLVFPAAQFKTDEMRKGVAVVLQALPAGISDKQAVLFFLTDCGTGQTPMQILEGGGDIGELVYCAKHYLEQGAF